MFSAPKVQELLKARFIPLACNDWYLRRQEDAAGEFWRGVSTQGPHKGEDGSTRQGRYVFTASGKLLGFNNNRGPDRLLTMLRESLKAWDALPAAAKKSNTATAAPGKMDLRFNHRPPEGGLILKVFTRVLNEDKSGWVRVGKPGDDADADFNHRGWGAARDHLWIRQDEIKSLLPPADAKPGSRYPLPERIARRIVRYHLFDNTRGEPPIWQAGEVRTAKLELIVESDSVLRVEGTFDLATVSGKRGHTGNIQGQMILKDGAINSWKMTALGDHWGEGALTGGARPGKTPLGHAFELVSGGDPADRIAPQASHFLPGYYEHP